MGCYPIEILGVVKYGRGYVVPEQRGRLIGKGPLPKEKLMKALGEVSSHCEIFFAQNLIYMVKNMPQSWVLFTKTSKFTNFTK